MRSLAPCLMDRTAACTFDCLTLGLACCAGHAGLWQASVSWASPPSCGEFSLACHGSHEELCKVSKAIRSLPRTETATLPSNLATPGHPRGFSQHRWALEIHNDLAMVPVQGCAVSVRRA